MSIQITPRGFGWVFIQIGVDMDFTDKRVLVTGASRGIGRSISDAFAQRGARIAIHFNQNRAAVEETREALPGGPHMIVQADAADPDAVEEMVCAVIAEMGGIDILVNNAGIYELHPIADIGYSEWQDIWSRTLGTNLIGAANVLFHCAKQMIKQGSGRIVNVSSRGAFRGEPDAPAYGASKAGLNALSQSMARALAPHGITVTVVAPGFVETEMAAPFLDGPEGDAIRNQSPMGRIAKPEEVARAVLFLASEGIESITGTIIDVNGASYLRS